MHDDLPPSTITRLAYGVFPSFAMLAGMHLDLFSQLSGEPATREQLARALDAQPERLMPLVYLLDVHVYTNRILVERRTLAAHAGAGGFDALHPIQRFAMRVHEGERPDAVGALARIHGEGRGPRRAACVRAPRI